MEDKKFTMGVKHLTYNAEMRKRRESMRLTQKQLEEMCELGKQSITRIEGFKLWPGEKEQAIIASALNTEIDILFPKWMKAFKIKRSSFSTEHIITERLLPNMVKNLELPSHIDNTEEQIDEEFLRKNIKDILGTLSDSEARVLKMRFGLSGEKSMYLEEVGHKFGVTRERIRQIEAKALRKLRPPSKERHLKEFL